MYLFSWRKWTNICVSRRWIFSFKKITGDGNRNWTVMFKYVGSQPFLYCWAHGVSFHDCLYIVSQTKRPQYSPTTALYCTRGATIYYIQKVYLFLRIWYKKRGEGTSDAFSEGLRKTKRTRSGENLLEEKGENLQKTILNFFLF